MGSHYEHREAIEVRPTPARKPRSDAQMHVHGDMRRALDQLFLAKPGTAQHREARENFVIAHDQMLSVAVREGVQAELRKRGVS